MHLTLHKPPLNRGKVGGHFLMGDTPIKWCFVLIASIGRVGDTSLPRAVNEALAVAACEFFACVPPTPTPASFLQMLASMRLVLSSYSSFSCAPLSMRQYLRISLEFILSECECLCMLFECVCARVALLVPSHVWFSNFHSKNLSAAVSNVAKGEIRILNEVTHVRALGMLPVIV